MEAAMRWEKYLLLAATMAISSGAWNPAAAQTSLNIYGVVDLALVYSSNQNGQSNTYMRSGNLAASRLGFKGTEDLGAGSQALFVLENGFEADTGAMSSSSTLFNRQAYVGLANSRYGTLTAGRQYTPYYLFVGPVGPVSALTGATGAHPGDIDGLDTTIRAKNALSYTSPLRSGAQVGVLYGLGEFAGQTGAGNAFSAALKYDLGLWNFALGYLRLKNGSAPGTFDPNASGSFTVSAVNQGYLSADAVQYIAAAARYSAGKLMLGVNASHVAYRPKSTSLFADTAIFNTAGLIASWQLHPALLVSAGYSYTRAGAANGIDDPARYDQLSLEQTYALSKRTSFYLLQAWQHSRGRTLGATGIGAPIEALAVVGDSQSGSSSSGGNQAVLMFGLRHSF
jgi:predicted porin